MCDEPPPRYSTSSPPPRAAPVILPDSIGAGTLSESPRWPSQRRPSGSRSSSKRGASDGNLGAAVQHEPHADPRRGDRIRSRRRPGLPVCPRGEASADRGWLPRCQLRGRSSRDVVGSLARREPRHSDRQRLRDRRRRCRCEGRRGFGLPRVRARRHGGTRRRRTRPGSHAVWRPARVLPRDAISASALLAGSRRANRLPRDRWLCDRAAIDPGDGSRPGRLPALLRVIRSHEARRRRRASRVRRPAPGTTKHALGRAGHSRSARPEKARWVGRPPPTRRAERWSLLGSLPTH